VAGGPNQITLGLAFHAKKSVVQLRCYAHATTCVQHLNWKSRNTSNPHLITLLNVSLFDEALDVILLHFYPAIGVKFGGYSQIPQDGFGESVRIHYSFRMRFLEDETELHESFANSPESLEGRLLFAVPKSESLPPRNRNMF
jgi:hypothetical protein